jgi:hypothetical protein
MSRDQAPWPCRWFGHKWRMPGVEGIGMPTWCVGGAEVHLKCARCGRGWNEPSREQIREALAKIESDAYNARQA